MAEGTAPAADTAAGSHHLIGAPGSCARPRTPTYKQRQAAPASVIPRKKRCSTRPVRSWMAAADVATMPQDRVIVLYHQRAPNRIVRKVEGMWATP